MVGSAWAAPTQKEQEEKRETLKNFELGVYDDQMTKLAKKHQMNTDTSRALFKILLTSEDFMDAFEKIQQLKLKGKKDREVIQVLVYCCQQEKNYNPYYAYLTNQILSIGSKQWSFTLKVTFWNFISSLQTSTEIEPHKVRNMAQLLGFLVRNGCLTLDVFKRLNTATLNPTPQTLLFIRKTLDFIFS